MILSTSSLNPRAGWTAEQLTAPPTIRGKRGRYHHGDLRRELIAAAVELIAEKGAAQVSLREVARRAGVTHAAPYRHFQDKSALLAAVAEEGFRELATEETAAISHPGQSPLELLQRLGIAYLRFAHRRPSHFRVMFSAELADRTAHPELEQAALVAFSYLLQAIGHCQEQGQLPPAPTEELALGAWSMVHGLSFLLIDGQLDVAGLGIEDAETLLRRATESLRPLPPSPSQSQ